MATIIITVIALIIFGAALYFSFRKGKKGGCGCGCGDKKQCDIK